MILDDADGIIAAARNAILSSNLGKIFRGDQLAGFHQGIIVSSRYEAALAGLA